MLIWEKLLNPIRRKEIHGSGEIAGTAAGRTEIERDYDRILFAAPTRRLADKTQVFPMEENDSVRTRLTHSHEVSNLARSIGVKLAFEHAEAVFGANHESLDVKRNVPPLLAAVGLAHDLGNPPFGHQGEKAMQDWFKNRYQDGSVEVDFLEFDGNAQTFRLLTQLQVLNDQYGLNLTVATLAALIKYPTVYGSGDKCGYKKYGIFRSEQSAIEDVWLQVGLSAGVRHPLAYVMEACDDIAYSVIDAEDTVKKGYASFNDLMEFLRVEGSKNEVVCEVVDWSTNKYKNFIELGKSEKPQISSRELNDISMQMFRVKAISKMVESTTSQFVSGIDNIMAGGYGTGVGLIERSECAELCAIVKSFAKNFGFQHREVLKLELQGSNHIAAVMNVLWDAIDTEVERTPFQKFVYGTISENYRRVYERSEKSDYCKRQLMCDAISGMTESYLVKRHQEYKHLSNA